MADEASHLLTTTQVARILNVSKPTIINWIEKDVIPYVQLPAPGGQRRKFRIPFEGLLATLEGTYDIALLKEQIEEELGITLKDETAPETQ